MQKFGEIIMPDFENDEDFARWVRKYQRSPNEDIVKIAERIKAGDAIPYVQNISSQNKKVYKYSSDGKLVFTYSSVKHCAKSLQTYPVKINRIINDGDLINGCRLYFEEVESSR